MPSGYNEICRDSITVPFIERLFQPLQQSSGQPYLLLQTLFSILRRCSLTKKARGPRPLGPKEIDGLVVPPGKASMLLTDHLITV